MPWEVAIKSIGLELSSHKAKRIVQAFRAMPSEISSDMDEHRVSLNSRLDFLRLRRSGRSGAAAEIWEALKSNARPELLHRACTEAHADPDLEPDAAIALAKAIHDHYPVELDPFHNPEEGEADLLSPTGTVPVDPDLITRIRHDLADLIASITTGSTLNPYDQGSLKLLINDLNTQLADTVEAAAVTHYRIEPR